MGSSESNEKKEDQKDEGGFISTAANILTEAGKAVGIGAATEVGSKTVDYAWDKFNE